MLLNCKNEQELIDVENYIGKEYHKCIYLYLDLKKYGIFNENIKTWIQYNENGEITAVILKYYTGLHIFSKEQNYNVEELKKLILQEKPTMICGEKIIISTLYNSFEKSKYSIETGWVRKLSEIESFDRSDVELASEDDFSGIAKLLYEDEDLGSSYEYEELRQQMIERNKEGFVRNYVIKDLNKSVISHAGTGAENDKVAMLSYVITDPKHRGKGYAKKLCCAVCEDLIKEGKNVFLINYSKESTALYDKIGFKICAEWGKMFLNLKENN